MSSSETYNGLPRLVALQCKIQTAGALGIGLAHLLLPPHLLVSNPITRNINKYILCRPPLPASIPETSELVQQTALVGLFCTAISFAYLLTFYHGYSEWIHLSIPARLGIGVLGVVVAMLMPEKISPLMFIVCVNDWLTAAWAGWMVGDWSGRKGKGKGEKQ